MFDFSKAASAVADLDSRLEQLANQQKITNGLLALLIIVRTIPNYVLDIEQMIMLDSLIEKAFVDK